MENYEQKYKEALEWMRSVYSTMTGTDKEDAEHYFPELKENMDEKTKRKLLELFNDMEWDDSTFHDYDLEKEGVIAWLEKQGEQQTSFTWKHWTGGIIGNEDGAPIYLVKIGNIYSITSCLGTECDYIELSELDDMLKKLRDIAEGRRPAEEEPKPKRKPGRPKGSKNKKSEKPEAGKPEQKRKPGRPKGSKKGGKQKAKTDEPKRSPGRPKGSKNKKTLLREAELAKREKRMKRKNDSG